MSQVLNILLQITKTHFMSVKA